MFLLEEILAKHFSNSNNEVVTNSKTVENHALKLYQRW